MHRPSMQRSGRPPRRGGGWPALLGALLFSGLMAGACSSPGPISAARTTVPPEADLAAFAGTYELLGCRRRSEWHEIHSRITVTHPEERTLVLLTPPPPGPEERAAKVGGVIREIGDIDGPALTAQERDALGGEHRDRTRAWSRPGRVFWERASRGQIGPLPARDRETLELRLTPEGGLRLLLGGTAGSTDCLYRRSPPGQ